MKLKIALLQLLPGNTQVQNLAKGIAACRQARALGADVALFPEMWNNGYALPQDEGALLKTAVSAEGDFVRAFGELAAELGMAIEITFLEKNSPKPMNSAILFDRYGRKVLHYSKVHTCSFDLEKVLSPGGDFPVADLDTAGGPVRVGSMICFDREFPESARILMLKGAGVILAPNACPMEINRLSALRTRAYENMLAIATCNYPSGQPDCCGRSTVFDGVAWLQNEEGVRDMCILEAPEEEGVYLAAVDMDQLRLYRTNEVMGSRFRRPETYSCLTETGAANENPGGPAVEIKRIGPSSRSAVNSFIREHWFSTEMAVRGELTDLSAADGFMACAGDRILGLITFMVRGSSLEIMSLDSVSENRGIGTALLDRAVCEADSNGYGAVTLITTNDNTRALRFYQKRGFDVVSLRRNAVEISRRLKPDIPLLGNDGIPIRHEVELILTLKRTAI